MKITIVCTPSQPSYISRRELEFSGQPTRERLHETLAGIFDPSFIDHLHKELGYMNEMSSGQESCLSVRQSFFQSEGGTANSTKETP